MVKMRNFTLSMLYYNIKENKCHHIPGYNKKGLYRQKERRRVVNTEKKDSLRNLEDLIL